MEKWSTCRGLGFTRLVIRRYGDDAFNQSCFNLKEASIPDHELGEVSCPVLAVKDWLDEWAPESGADGAEADDVTGGTLA